MKNFEILRKVAVPVLLTSSLVIGACSSEEAKTHVSSDHSNSQNTLPDKCKNTDGLTKVRVIGASKEGGTNVVNGGECVGVYDSNTLRTIGTITTGDAFIVECVDYKPASFEVILNNGIHGNVNLGNALGQKITSGDLSNVAECSLTGTNLKP